MVEPGSGVPDGWAETWIRVIESWNRGERQVDYEFLHPAFHVRSELAKREFTGKEGLWQWYSEIEGSFDRWTVRPDADFFEPEGPAGCLMCGEIDFRGRESGIELTTPVCWAFTFEQGLLRWFGNYRDLEEARAAVYDH